MPKTVTDPELDEALGDMFKGLAPAGPDKPATDLLTQLLESSDADDPNAITLDAEELGALEEEFENVARLKETKEALKAKLDVASATYEAARGRMLSAMKLQGTKQFRGADGQGSCSIQERFDTKVTDPVEFMAWVQENHPELLTVNSQTRSGFIRKEYKDKGVPPEADEFPPGIEPSTREVLQVRGARTKKAQK